MMTSDEIENGLIEGARLVNQSVDEYRQAIESIASKYKLPFEFTLAIFLEFSRMSKIDLDNVKQDLNKLKDSADRVGMSVEDYVEKVLGHDLKKSPRRH